MRITVELDFDVTEHIDNNGNVTLDAVRWIGDTHDQLPHMDALSQIKIQAETECAVEKAEQERFELKQMRGDFLRERARDDALTGVW